MLILCFLSRWLSGCMDVMFLLFSAYWRQFHIRSCVTRVTALYNAKKKESERGGICFCYLFFFCSFFKKREITTIVVTCSVCISLGTRVISPWFCKKLKGNMVWRDRASVFSWKQHFILFFYLFFFSYLLAGDVFDFGQKRNISSYWHNLLTRVLTKMLLRFFWTIS